MGRPAFDDTAKRAFITRIQRGRSPAIAAEEVGFAMSTVKRELRADVDFADAYNDALAMVNGQVEEVLLEKALDGEFQALKFWLNNRAKDRWRDESTVRSEVSGPGGSPIQIAQSSVLTLRQVLADPETRVKALEMVDDMPVLDAEVVEDNPDV